MLRSSSPGAGVNTLTLRVASPGIAGSGMSVFSPGFSRFAVAPYASASRTPSQGSGGTGAANRRSPTGAWANGMPRKRRRPVAPRAADPARCDGDDRVRMLRHGCSSFFGVVECVEESIDGGGHVDVRIQHPLDLHPVGDRLEDPRQCLSVDTIAELTRRLPLRQRAREHGAQRVVAFDEVLVGRMLRVGRIDGEAREELHQPGHIAVVPDRHRGSRRRRSARFARRGRAAHSATMSTSSRFRRISVNSSSLLSK